MTLLREEIENQALKIENICSSNTSTASYVTRLMRSCNVFFRVMRMRKQSGVRWILRVYKEHARVAGRSENAFAKLCQK